MVETGAPGVGAQRGDVFQPHDPAPLSFYVFVYSLAIVAVILFALLVYWFAARGDSFVRHLSGEIGDVVAIRAQNLANAGQTDEAISLFQRALERPFDQPQQHVRALQKFARLLMEEGEHREAVAIMAQALQLDENDGWNYGLLAQALQHSGQYAELERLSQKWFVFAERSGNATNMMYAEYYRGLALLDAGDQAAAVEAFVKGFEIEHAATIGINAARLLQRRGASEEAAPILDWLLENASGQVLEEARALKSSSTTGTRSK